MSTPKAVLLAAAIALTSSAALAGWQDEASPFDAQRLSHLDEARAKGLAQAQGGNDLAAIHDVLDAPATPLAAKDFTGRWRCRTIKLGGITPSIVYGWFTCRITQNGDELLFEKLTGSQHFSGKLYPDSDGRTVVLGAWTVKGEKPHLYSGNHEQVGAPSTPDDAIGVLEATGADHARVEFPYPVQESTFDVIELKR